VKFGWDLKLSFGIGRTQEFFIDARAPDDFSAPLGR
jgi:hypothetical protein